MAGQPKRDWLRVPSKRDASQRRLRAQMDERFAVLRVLHAGARRRYADATIRAIDAFELLRQRLELEQRSGADRLSRLRRQAERILSRSDGP